MRNGLILIGRHKDDGRLVVLRQGVLPKFLRLAVVLPEPAVNPPQQYIITNKAHLLTEGKWESLGSCHAAFLLPSLRARRSAVVVIPNAQIAIKLTPDAIPSQQDLVPLMWLVAARHGMRVTYWQAPQLHLALVLNGERMSHSDAKVDAVGIKPGRFISRDGSVNSTAFLLGLSKHARQ